MKILLGRHDELKKRYSFSLFYCYNLISRGKHIILLVRTKTLRSDTTNFIVVNLDNINMDLILYYIIVNYDSARSVIDKATVTIDTSCDEKNQTFLML